MSGRAVILTSSVVVFAAFLALLGLALFRSGGEPGSLGVNKDFGEVSIEEKPAPDFTLELLQGGSVSLGDLRGRVVLVDFWASWCPPCIEEAPILNSVYEEYRERGVEFLGVCIWDTTKGCEQFLQEFDVAYPSGRDSEGAILVDYGVKGIPEKFFIDAQGRVGAQVRRPCPGGGHPAQHSGRDARRLRLRNRVMCRRGDRPNRNFGFSIRLADWPVYIRPTGSQTGTDSPNW